MAEWIKCDGETYRTKLMRPIFYVGPYGDCTSDVYWELNRPCTVEELIEDIAHSLPNEFCDIHICENREQYDGDCVKIKCHDGKLNEMPSKRLCEMPVKWVRGSGGWYQLRVYICVGDFYKETRGYKDYVIHKMFEKKGGIDDNN